MEKYNTLKDKNDYISFLANKEEYLKYLANLLNKETLSFNDEEVKIISRYFIDLKGNCRFGNIDKRKFITYLGEAFIKRYGGEWDFTGLKSDSYAINEPVITKYLNEGLRKSPSETIEKIFEGNDDNYFNWSNKNMEDFQKKIDDVFAKIFPKRKKR